ncbi:cyclophilin-like fold protein [Inquilinus sp. NPDC058860]|uniref:cyclophilin-like fold protein n=1 Tax=Inquilinus sp. NPDC058860 TaxID=3346652 RepID=UPI0036AB8669
MKLEPRSLGRRALLGAVLVGAAMPHAAPAQTAPPKTDLCHYAPWGNLAFFYAGYRYSRGLIRLGRLDGGIEPLLTRGKFPLRVEPLS